MDPIDDYISFSEECLSVDGLALVEYALELKAQGCSINLAGASGVGNGVGAVVEVAECLVVDHCKLAKLAICSSRCTLTPNDSVDLESYVAHT